MKLLAQWLKDVNAGDKIMKYLDDIVNAFAKILKFGSLDANRQAFHLEHPSSQECLTTPEGAANSPFIIEKLRLTIDYVTVCTIFPNNWRGGGNHYMVVPESLN